MPRVIVVTNPSHDSTTNYLDAWVTDIISSISLDDTEIHELREDNVTQIKLENLLKTKNPHLVLFNGHGSHDCMTGFNFAPIIKCGLNEHVLVDKIVNCLSCDSGKTLGPELIKIGSKAFIGYKDEFKFSHLNRTTNKERLNDIVATLCLEPAFEVVKTLINGGTVNEAYDNSQNQSKNNLRILLGTKMNSNISIIASQIYHNLTHQVQLGDIKVKL